MPDNVTPHRVQVFHRWRDLRADVTALRSEYPAEGEGLTDVEFVKDAWDNGVTEPYIVDATYEDHDD